MWFLYFLTSVLLWTREIIGVGIYRNKNNSSLKIMIIILQKCFTKSCISDTIIYKLIIINILIGTSCIIKK